MGTGLNPRGRSSWDTHIDMVLPMVGTGHRGCQEVAKAAHGGAAPTTIPGLGAHRKGQPGEGLTHP